MKNLSSDMDYETRKYWAQVLQIVREEMPIGKTGTDISESYVAMIAGLGVAETWMGNFTNAKHHKDAMLKLVAARGGFSTFGSMAQRALKWCEFYPCACLTLRPTLPQLPVHHLHPDVIKTAGTGHRRTMEHLPDQLEESELNMIFFQLHTVALVQLSAPQPAFASVLDDLEHRLLVELFEQKEKFEASPSADPTDLVYAGMLQAAQMCVFGMMTFTRKETPMYGVFAATLRRILDVPNVIDTWRKVASAQSLLWVFFIGWSTGSRLKGDAAGALDNAKWFIRHFSSLIEIIEIREVKSLRRVMRDFPWNPKIYNDPLNSLWNIYLHREDLDMT
ncbi:hypothetical protein DBV05_g6602 [Lasiodiplodia theobromae]|uniref:Uncharacterized protein n=1 Tax=Lasiodiplodia theobromae TaxID=45133 RepID=A0A5N5DC48_9PEZI|nr:hypothetical protein DBV05_g6602 [Lasiodiplodia theobromae]